MPMIPSPPMAPSNRHQRLRPAGRRPRIEAIRIVDMSSSNSWAEFAALFRSTRNAFWSMSELRPNSRHSFLRMPKPGKVSHRHDQSRSARST
jgi:hypothetical protein